VALFLKNSKFGDKFKGRCFKAPPLFSYPLLFIINLILIYTNFLEQKTIFLFRGFKIIPLSKTFTFCNIANFYFSVNFLKEEFALGLPEE